MVNRISRRARRGIAAVVLALAMVSAAAPAHALDGPQAWQDRFTSHQRGTVGGNVLANDSWDAAHTATVTSATLIDAYYSDSGNPIGFESLSPSVNFTSAGMVTVDFGSYNGIASGYRIASVRYTMTDSAGQSSHAVAWFWEINDPRKPAAADDDNASLGLPDPVDFERDSQWLVPTGNDTIAMSHEYTFEVVEQPQYGTVTSDGTGFIYRLHSGETFEPRTDSFRYRLVLNDDPMVVSNTATVTLNTVKTLGTPVERPQMHDSDDWAFYEGGPTEVVSDPRRELAEVYGEDALDGLTFDLSWFGGDYEWGGQFGDLTENGDGTYTYALTGTGGVDRANWNLLDADGRQVGSYQATFQYLAPGASAHPLSAEPTPIVLEDDEVWVATGQLVHFEPILNDNIEGAKTYTRRWVLPEGHEPVSSHPSLRLLSDPKLGVTSSNGTGVSGEPMWGDGWGRQPYKGGMTPGTDTFDYEVCAPYPKRAWCDTATVTVHVSPLAVAADDERDGARGATVLVDVLDNDTFTDKPGTPAKATVTDVPKGVKAKVTGDRTVSVSVPADYKGSTVSLGYRLTDFTGSSEARVLVRVAAMQAPEVPVGGSPVPPADPTPDTPVADPVPTPTVPVPTPTDPETPEEDTPDTPEVTDTEDEPKRTPPVIHAGGIRQAVTEASAQVRPLVAMTAGLGLMVALIVVSGLRVARRRDTQ